MPFPQPPFATVTDLETRWRDLTVEEMSRAQAFLEDASSLVMDEFPGAHDASPATLRRVVCAMVKRAMAAPGGIGVASLMQGAGPFQQTTQFSNPTGDLYLTKSEKRSLGVGRQRAFEIDLLGGSDG